VQSTVLSVEIRCKPVITAAQRAIKKDDAVAVEMKTIFLCKKKNGMLLNPAPN